VRCTQEVDTRALCAVARALPAPRRLQTNNHGGPPVYTSHHAVSNFRSLLPTHGLNTRAHTLWQADAWVIRQGRTNF